MTMLQGLRGVVWEDNFLPPEDRSLPVRKDKVTNPGITAHVLDDLIGVRPLNMVSLDPGDKHCGFVSWDQGVPDHLEEMTPDRCVEVLERMSRTSWLDLVVIEEWRLYPTMAEKMVGSEFPTSQLIGVIRYLMDREGVPYHLQPAQIKYPTMGIMRNRGFRLVSKRTGCSGHVQDAELHGWYFMIEGYKRFQSDLDIRKIA